MHDNSIKWCQLIVFAAESRRVAAVSVATLKEQTQKQSDKQTLLAKNRDITAAGLLIDTARVKGNAHTHSH